MSVEQSPLDRLAERFGVALGHDAWGRQITISDEAKRRLLTALGLSVDRDDALEEELRRTDGTRPPVLEPAKDKACFLPSWLREHRAWGITLQLYELRSSRNWGIGDFADLVAFAPQAAETGADFIGLNPLHALFLAAPERNSPFSPSSRRFLNPLYIAPDLLPGGAPQAHEADAIASLTQSDHVDYPTVAGLKLGALRRAWDAWKAGNGDPALSPDAFAGFCREGGDALSGHARFEALSLHMAAAGRGAGWTAWPAEFRDCRGEAVEAFVSSHADEVSFHLWLQWICRVQLDGAARAAREAGMRIGLYLDFAVGEAPDGSATWSGPNLVVPGVTVGAPPDMFTTEGQNWNLAALSPLALAREEFRPFRAAMESLMRSAGALRIDHAMALWQLFLVPEGGRPAEGVYLRYPIERMLDVLAEASNAAGTVVIGEDLGHVPPGFRDVMGASNILSYRIIYFENTEDGGFKRPEHYPALALACLSTHDLPTWKGWWRGDDIRLRLEHGLITAEGAAQQERERAYQRGAMASLFRETGETPGEVLDAALHAPDGELPDALAVAAHRFVARTPSLLCGVRLADLLGETRATNLPGTTDSYPNWQPRLSVPVETMGAQPLFQAVTKAVTAERPRQS